MLKSFWDNPIENLYEAAMGLIWVFAVLVGIPALLGMMAGF